MEEGEEEEGSKGATQARKVKLSLVVSESSWMYVMPNLFRVTWEKSGWVLREEKHNYLLNIVRLVLKKGGV